MQTVRLVDATAGWLERRGRSVKKLKNGGVERSRCYYRRGIPADPSWDDDGREGHCRG